MDSNKLGSKIKNAIFGNKKKHEDELTPADVNFTKAAPPEEQKTMNFKWSFEFVITTGIMKETVKSIVETEVDSERVAFGLALNKIIATEKFRASTDAPRYTQKFTKEKITQE